MSRLQVSGSLSFEVRDGSQATTGTVTADGSTLTLHAQDPAVALRDLLGEPGPVVSTVLQRLHDDGLTLVVTGPEGELARAGAGVDSMLGRLLAGSRLVQPGRPRALAPLARARLRVAAGRSRPWLLFAALVAGGSVVWRRIR